MEVESLNLSDYLNPDEFDMLPTEYQVLFVALLTQRIAGKKAHSIDFVVNMQDWGVIPYRIRDDITRRILNGNL